MTRGPAPKSPETRQRRNKAATEATLSTDGPQTRRAPRLPRRIIQAGHGPACPLWHPNTARWWKNRWRSPMAAEYLPADEDRMLHLAALVDRYEWAVTAGAETSVLVRLSSEIRHLDGEMGGTPMARRRLDWKIARTDPLVRKQRATPTPAPADDPRRGLSALAGGLA